MRFLPMVMLAAFLTAGDAPRQRAAEQDRENLQGVWKVVSVSGFKKEDVRKDFRNLRMIVRGDTITAHYGDRTAEGTYHLQANRNPPRIDVTLTRGPQEVQGKVFKGIYLLEDNTLKVVYRNPGGDRPTEFVTEGETGVYKVFFRKESRAARR